MPPTWSILLGDIERHPPKNGRHFRDTMKSINIYWDNLKRLGVEPESIDSLQVRIGFRFTNMKLLFTALSHGSSLALLGQKSGLEEQQEVQSNERLEFLGDSVLGMVMSSLLFEKEPNSPEGRLSKLKAHFVSSQSLAKYARSIGLQEAILLGRGERFSAGPMKDSILANALEALFGAVYLDGGYEEASRVILKVFESDTSGSLDHFLQKDFKTQLQELVQKEIPEAPEYVIVGSDGPDHAQTFEVALSISGKEVARSNGPSKKAAAQSAAKVVLDSLARANKTLSGFLENPIKTDEMGAAECDQ